MRTKAGPSRTPNPILIAPCVNTLISCCRGPQYRHHQEHSSDQSNQAWRTVTNRSADQGSGVRYTCTLGPSRSTFFIGMCSSHSPRVNTNERRPGHTCCTRYSTGIGVEGTTPVSRARLLYRTAEDNASNKSG